MQWSNLIKKKSQSVDSNTTVLEYQPREFKLGTPDPALDYLQRKEKGSDFVLSDVLRQTTGVDQIEKESEEQKIEQKVLERVTVIQKQAYDEGFKLGKADGFKSAFSERNQEINRGMQDLNELLMSIQGLKPDLIQFNEAHIMQTIMLIAQKLVYSQIETNPEIMIDIIRNAIQAAQADEDVTVLLAPEQVEFLEKYKLSENEQHHFLKNVKLQASDQIKSGGCIVETNYGAIDARIEERINKLWEDLYALTPKVKTSVGA